MAKINGNEIRPGNVVEHDGGLWVAVKTNTVKPGKGGAYNQVELKNLLNGTKLNERFRSAETVERVQLDLKDFTFLYEQGDALVFMDTESYEQLELNKDFVGERAAFLRLHPVCKFCGAPSTTVDHIIRHNGDPALFWNRSNWQALCTRCHNSVKQRQERRPRP